MFSGIRRLVGSVSVKQTEREILVSGVPADVMQRDIAKIWKTSRITDNMFNKIGRSEFSFNLFFAPDIVYMLDVMSKHRSRNTSVKVIASIRDEIIRNTWLSNVEDDKDLPGRLKFDHLKKFIYTPKPFQQGYFDLYHKKLDQYRLNGYLLAAAAGTGKTYTTLAVGECLEADRIIVVCPKNAVDRVWASSLSELYKTDKPTFWVYAHGKPYNGERVLVVHYEGLQPLLDLLPNVDLSGTVQIILDECHNLNEVGSQRTQLFEQVCKRSGSKDIVFASGTPIKALGAETIPLLRCIDPMFTADTEARYRKIFGRDGARGIDILRHRMGLISYKVEKSALNLEKPIMKPLPVVMPSGKDFTLTAIRRDMEKFIAERWVYYKGRRKEDEAFWNQCIKHHKQSLRSRQQTKEFEEYVRVLNLVIKSPDPRYVGDEIKATNAYEKNKFGPSLPKEWIKQFRDVKSVIKYTHLKIQGECLGRVLGRKRIECHVAMVPYLDFIGVCESTTKKTVMFTSFVEALEAGETQCKTLGLKPLVVYGKTNNELAQTVSRFERDEGLNPLLATFNSLSTAVPLVMADTMLMFNSPFRAYIFEQAISRIHRLGADTQTVVYQAHLDTGDEPNISTRSADILQWSQDAVESIMGIRSPFEVTASLECQQDLGIDESHLLLHHLRQAFGPFDIEPSLEDFSVSKVTASATPAFMNW